MISSWAIFGSQFSSIHLTWSYHCLLHCLHHLTISCIPHCSLMSCISHSVSSCFTHYCFQCLHLGHPWHTFHLVGVLMHFCAVRYDRFDTVLVDSNLVICARIRVWPDCISKASRQCRCFVNLTPRIFSWLVGAQISELCHLFYGIVLHRELVPERFFRDWRAFGFVGGMFILSWWFPWKNLKNSVGRFLNRRLLLHHRRNNSFVDHSISEIWRCYFRYNFVHQEIICILNILSAYVRFLPKLHGHEHLFICVHPT